MPKTKMGSPTRGLKIVEDQLTYQALMPGLVEAYETTVPTDAPLSASVSFRDITSVQLFLEGLSPQTIEWDVVIRENRRYIRIEFEEVNNLMDRLGLPRMKGYIDRLTWGADPSDALRLAAVRAALQYSGAPGWCSEVFSESIFGQPSVGYDLEAMDDPTMPFGFRNVKKTYFYIPGPMDLSAAESEEGCHYCLIYRGRHAVRPTLDYQVDRKSQVVGVRHRDIASLLRLPDVTGVPVISEVSNGRVYYTAQSIHNTRDVLHALSQNHIPMHNAACTVIGNHSYYKSREEGTK